MEITKPGSYHITEEIHGDLTIRGINIDVQGAGGCIYGRLIIDCSENVSVNGLKHLLIEDEANPFLRVNGPAQSLSNPMTISPQLIDGIPNVPLRVQDSKNVEIHHLYMDVEIHDIDGLPYLAYLFARNEHITFEDSEFRVRPKAPVYNEDKKNIAYTCIPA